MPTSSRTPRPRRPLFAFAGALLLLSSSPGLASATRPIPPGKKHGVDSAADVGTNGGEVEPPSEPIEDLSVAGRILPVLRGFALTSDKIRNAAAALSEAVDLKEFGFLAAFGWVLVPAVTAARNALVGVGHAGMSLGGDDAEGNEDAGEDTKDFSETYLYHIIESGSQAARIGTAIYAVDCVAIALNSLGFKYQQQAGFSKKAANISYTVWAALRIGELKKFLLDKAFRPKEGDVSDMSKARILNKVLNVVLVVVTGGHILDMFEIDLGLAAKSLLTFGGVGTLVLSLASKDLASEFVSGLVLSASDRFDEGDEIELGDKTAGIISGMGLLYTDLRGFDEITTRIPNHQLANQRVRNLSRVTKCQVKQTLRFGYEDVDRIPDVVAAIKDEILASCPGLITDGSRPFRAHWQEFREDHLEVVVDCHFKVKPTGIEFFDNRQRVLEAIGRAVNRLGVKFTLPAQICEEKIVNKAA